MFMNKTHKQIYKIFVDIIDEEMVNVSLTYEWVKHDTEVYNEIFNENFYWSLQEEINDKYFKIYEETILRSDIINKFSALSRISELKEHPEELSQKYGGTVDTSKNWYSVGIGFMMACYLATDTLVPHRESVKLQSYFHNSVMKAAGIK